MKKYVLLVFLTLLVGSIIFLNEKEVEWELKVYDQNEVESALEDLQFKVKVPTYIPNGITMRGAVIYVLEREHRSIEIRYLNEDNADGLIFDASLGTLESLPENIQWEPISLNGQVGYIGHADDMVELFLAWMDNGIMYQITSYTLSEEELVRIANSVP
ncbi:DUF4367 domain-containing protein [Alkalihalobacterium elongatum]|uniref:DUF4367 domain-containing protein n=1 Tax=Alkalihalobacterium elongatum TaxID=2675466 RepID=UPI001C1FA38D|nr:DUF4367 domain-containing protein [Alkalihalobacterium elongatum]